MECLWLKATIHYPIHGLQAKLNVKTIYKLLAEIGPVGQISNHPLTQVRSRVCT